MPSKGWPNGSTGAWRKTRLEVLTRDRWVCRICGKPISRTLKFPHRGSASVHHTKGRRHGDDPRFLVACHMGCNWDIGEPDDTPPEPVPRTAW